MCMNVSVAAAFVSHVAVVVDRSYLPMPVQWLIQFSLDFAS